MASRQRRWLSQSWRLLVLPRCFYVAAFVAHGCSRCQSIPIHKSRNLLEWKAGRRIHIEGVRFGPAWNDGQSSSLMLVPANKDGGAGDLSVTNSEFAHGPGVTQVCGQYEEGPPMARCYFGNNLFWDIGGYGSGALGGYGDEFSGTGHAYVFQGGSGNEDTIIDHNTIFPLRGDISSIIEITIGDTPFDNREGMSVTNNILPISDIGGKFGLYDEAQCASGGEATVGSGCANWKNYTWKNNLMYPSAWSFADHVTHIGPFDMSSNATQSDGAKLTTRPGKTTTTFLHRHPSALMAFFDCLVFSPPLIPLIQPVLMPITRAIHHPHQSCWRVVRISQPMEKIWGPT
jgi:hypothetical protein